MEYLYDRLDEKFISELTTELNFKIKGLLPYGID